MGEVKITREDIKAIRSDFNLHCIEHKCRPQECDTRLQLFNQIAKAAAMWNEPA